jgi:hypothetical protein
MKRQLLLLVAAAAAAAALLVPTLNAGTPKGQGLFGEHASVCTGGFSYSGLVTLVPGSGNSFWVSGHHLVIQSADVTPDGGQTVTYSFGAKRGPSTRPMETCEGDFPGYHVVSHDIIVP